ncbi:hypothetical protein [Winogradskyella wichelsiae]|uniref:hypothetical protein n=1 Tax=Winogradskyella wichelsiae TaxID=2697007 RepID=UPI003EF606BA
MQFLSHFFKSIIKACPYSLLGKHCISAFKEKPNTDKTIKNKIQIFKSGIKTGRNIALIGVFCPFLWYAILSGAHIDFIILNTIHSGIVAGIGLVIISVNCVALYAQTRKG